MSLTGEVQKRAGDIREAIERIAQKNLAGLDGMPLGTKKIMGYVCAINTDGDLAGTVDVQEFNIEPGETETQGIGCHQGVLLSAIQNNEDGFLIVPQLYSDVVIVQNPFDGKEYVIMYSHAKKMQFLTHSTKTDDDGEIQIGVTEVEDFVETDDGLDKDFNELEPTKNKTLTKYTSKNIYTQITSPDDEEGFQEETTFEDRMITVGDTKISFDGECFSIITKKSISFQVGENTTIEQVDGKVTITVGDTKITEDQGSVSIETKNCTVKGTQIEVNGTQVKITGGQLTVQGQSGVDMNGPFNPIKACPFSGAPHCGSIVTGT